MALSAIQLGRTSEAPAGDLERLNRFLAELAPRWIYRHAAATEPAWLLAYFEPGDAWAPVERIVVAEMYPRKNLLAEHRFLRALGEGSDASKFAELEGPNPRWGGHYEPGVGFVHATWRPPPTITERQWLLWREHGALAIPTFILQGAAGGHPRHYSPWEREYRRVTLRQHEPGTLVPPVPGDRRQPFVRVDGVDPAFAALERELAYRRLSQELHEDWFTRPDETTSFADRRLRAIFDEWYSAANEARASGQVTDVQYDPARQRFATADYRTIPKGDDV